MVRNGKYGSSYCCNEKGCDPWVFAFPQCALSSTMRPSLTSFTPFSESFITRLFFLRFPPSLTPTSAAQEKAFKQILERNILQNVFANHYDAATVTKTLAFLRYIADKRWLFLQPVYFPRVLERDNAVIENINCR